MSLTAPQLLALGILALAAGTFVLAFRRREPTGLSRESALTLAVIFGVGAGLRLLPGGTPPSLRWLPMLLSLMAVAVLLLDRRGRARRS